MRENPRAIPAAAAPCEDEEIVRRVVGGEVDLFELLMRRHNQRIYRAVRSFVKDESEAEDVMQQAYVSAYRHLADFDFRARFSTWLTRIAVHEAMGRVRAARRFVALDGGEAMVPSDGAGPEERAAGRELLRLLESAIDELPDTHRSAFVLREVEGLSTADAAAVLEISEDALKQRLHRSKSMLKERLARLMEAETPGAFPFEAPRCDRVVAAVLAKIRG